MNVLLMASHFNTGGISTYMTTLSRGLMERGCRVFVASSGGNLVNDAGLFGLRHVAMDICVKCDIHPKLLWSLPALVQLIRSEKIDIIHANTRVAQVLAALASLITGVPWVSTCHGFYQLRWGRRMMPLWGKKVIAISHAVEHYLLNDFHVHSNRVVFVSNGVDLNVFKPLGDFYRRELKKANGLEGEPVIGVVARFSDVKGLSYLIDAMPLLLKDFPKLKCLLAGQGPMEQALKSQVEHLGLKENVLFYPVVNRPAEMLPLMDVFVLPSLSEGLGLSVLEAQACGVPVVASSVGGILDIIRDGETGWVVPPRDVQTLAGCVRKVLSSADLRAQVAIKARDFVAAHFSATTMVDRTLDVYRSVTGRV